MGLTVGPSDNIPQDRQGQDVHSVQLHGDAAEVQLEELLVVCQLQDKHRCMIVNGPRTQVHQHININ